MQGKPEKTMIPHLIKCTKVSPEVREKAKQSKNKEQESIPPPHISITPSVSRASTPASCRAPFTSIQTWLSASNLASYEPTTPDAPMILVNPPPAKQQRTETWTASTQREFSADILKVFVSAGIPWNAASDPELRLFCKKWIPGSKVPDRRVLSGRLLDKEAMHAESRMKKMIEGKLGTGQCDGWKNVARASIVASMVTVEGKVSLAFRFMETSRTTNLINQAYLMRTHDVSAEQKTGEFLYQLVVEDIQFIETKYGVIIVAYCCDDSGDGRKMRRLLFCHMNWLIILLCWAHQMNLIVGDFLKLRIDCLQCVTQAVEVVKWFNNHSRALGLLRQEQVITYHKVLALILPVITRWTAHYLSSRRLLEVSTAIRACGLRHKETLLLCAGPKAEARAKATSVIAITQDNVFWTRLAKYVLSSERIFNTD
jgi:hypothetical protein